MTVICEIHEALDLSAPQTVPRNMVHRSALTEVFLTGGIKIDEAHFQCSAQLPRTNIYYNDLFCIHLHYDLMLLMEIFRQASIYVSHAFLGVSLEDKFLYIDSDTSIPTADHLCMGSVPISAVVDVRVVGEYRRRSALQGVTLDMTLLLGGKAVARHERMTIRWMGPEAWGRMREKGLARFPDGANARCASVRPVAAKTVGRNHYRNVVIGDQCTERDGQFRVDLLVPFENGAIFDHPLDHIPGMLLLEAFRQTALVAIGRTLNFPPERLVLARCKANFAQFGEFGRRTECAVRQVKITLAPSQDFLLCDDMAMEQDGNIIANASLSFLQCDIKSVFAVALPQPAEA